MSTNPLQQYFRQPKIWISLPSGGALNDPDFFGADPSKVPVFSMTGMDEILAKTPDALLSGESSLKIIKSCVPSIKDPSKISSLDLQTIFTAIRIATYGNSLEVNSNCPTCQTENTYDINLSGILDYFRSIKLNTNLVLGDLSVYFRPLEYQNMIMFSIKNFQLQRKFQQVSGIDDEKQLAEIIKGLYAELADLQKDIYLTTIESIHMPNGSVVTEKPFIKEWLENLEQSLFDKIRDFVNEFQDSMNLPMQNVTCTSCQKDSKLALDLDYSNFFVKA